MKLFGVFIAPLTSSVSKHSFICISVSSNQNYLNKTWTNQVQVIKRKKIINVKLLCINPWFKHSSKFNILTTLYHLYRKMSSSGAAYLWWQRKLQHFWELDLDFRSEQSLKWKSWQVPRPVIGRWGVTWLNPVLSLVETDQLVHTLRQWSMLLDEAAT